MRKNDISHNVFCYYNFCSVPEENNRKTRRTVVWDTTPIKNQSKCRTCLEHEDSRSVSIENNFGVQVPQRRASFNEIEQIGGMWVTHYVILDGWYQFINLLKYWTCRAIVKALIWFGVVQILGLLVIIIFIFFGKWILFKEIVILNRQAIAPSCWEKVVKVLKTNLVFTVHFTIILVFEKNWRKLKLYFIFEI